MMTSPHGTCTRAEELDGEDGEIVIGFCTRKTQDVNGTERSRGNGGE